MAINFTIIHDFYLFSNFEKAKPSLSPSAMVSGKGLPNVSGKIKDARPAERAAKPKNNGA